VQDRPTASELLETIARFLDDELLSALEGGLQYRVRVASNLVKILEREVRLGPEALERECARLSGVLQIEVLHLDVAALGATGEQRVRELNRRLVERLQAPGEDDELERRAWSALMAIARDKLAIARPGYADADAGGGDG
jgi:hypothetical protein